jgi:two-component system KDP operon response regulator KdpE
MSLEVLTACHDEATIDDIIQVFTLCQFRCKLKKTNSGKQCVEIVKSNCPDIVVLDKNLSDGDGFDAIRQIRSFSQVPIIFLSCIANEYETVKALELGADEYIIKPIRQLEFMAYVRALLRKSK